MTSPSYEWCPNCDRVVSYLRDGICQACYYENLPKPFVCICGKGFPVARGLAGHIGAKARDGQRDEHAIPPQDSDE